MPRPFLEALQSTYLRRKGKESILQADNLRPGETNKRLASALDVQKYLDSQRHILNERESRLLSQCSEEKEKMILEIADTTKMRPELIVDLFFDGELFLFQRYQTFLESMYVIFGNEVDLWYQYVTITAVNNAGGVRERKVRKQQNKTLTGHRHRDE